MDRSGASRTGRLEGDTYLHRASQFNLSEINLCIYLIWISLEDAGATFTIASLFDPDSTFFVLP